MSDAGPAPGSHGSAAASSPTGLPGAVPVPPAAPRARRLEPLLATPAGERAALLGNEAIVRGALEAGVGFACGYPGTPSSEITDGFARVAAARGIQFEYSVNEKVCLEMAFAAALAGARAICAMKHLGLMVAGDPLSTIPYIGVRAGLVIVSAGDPSCLTSPNEQDQRHLGPMLHLVVLDPSTPQEAHDLTLRAFEVSEAARLPVLLRITTRVAHSRAAVCCGTLREPEVKGFQRDPQGLVPVPHNARRMRLAIEGRLEAARAAMQAAGLYSRHGHGRHAILASGAPAATCRDILAETGICGPATGWGGLADDSGGAGRPSDGQTAADGIVLATTAGLHPLPEEELVQLLGDMDTVLVVEELSPFLEDAVRALACLHGLPVRVLGKRTGHLPLAFEYEPQVIRAGLEGAFGLAPPVAAPVAAETPTLPPRPPTLCPGCPHRSTYFAARAAFEGEAHLYFNDIGCYTLGYGEPLHAVDALLCMGAGFTLAAGVARVTGERTVGFMGDSTFFHAGMPALLNAAKENVGMVAVILDNQVTAMTGFQESPTVQREGTTVKRTVSIAAVCRALGATQVEVVDPTNLAATIAAFERARAATGLYVVIAEEPCPLFLGQELGQSAGGPHVHVIDQTRCRACGRAGCGMQCRQRVVTGFERQLARNQALQVDPAARRDTLRTAAPRESFPVAPCAERCPLGICIQGYTAHIAAGRYDDALELIADRCALPATVCRVCHRPCEADCVHAPLGAPVAINDLKRFVVEQAPASRRPYQPPRDPPSGYSVAVVGAGPAGLAAAHDLALRGHEVTLYDAGDRPGGLLAHGIPGFRLPRAALASDVERIFGLGVRFEGGRVLGQDLSLAQLLGEGGHAAVLLTLGAHATRALALAGAATAGVPPLIEALDYLKRVQSGQPAPSCRQVVVVGGGNAAFDAARTALRRGAAAVAIVYRRRWAELPALADEVAAAQEEGVQVHCQCQPVALVAPTADAPAGIVCRPTVPGAPDRSGRAQPLVAAGETIFYAADLVIAAVGQAADTAFLATGALALEREPDGSLVVDPVALQTSHPRVFAAGDVTGGERTVTSAMAQGQRAAWGIDRALRGRELADRHPPPPRPGDGGDWPRTGQPVSRFSWGGLLARRQPPAIGLAARRAGFAEVQGSLDEATARAEAARCQSCGQCANCRACLDLFGCPAFYVADGRIWIDPKLCNGCGVCAELCPNGAIIPLGTEAAP